jgi:hypothetical protein
MNGQGVFSWPDKKYYKGNYLGDRKEGYGEIFWSDSKYYKGYWKNGFQHGEGEMLENGLVTKGKWENGKFVTS